MKVLMQTVRIHSVRLIPMKTLKIQKRLLLKKIKKKNYHHYLKKVDVKLQFYFYLLKIMLYL